MSRQEHSRSRADPALLAALAAGATIDAAAKSAGVSPATVRRRLADPAFRERLDLAQGELVAQAVAALSGASGEAVATLRRLLRDAPPATQLGAARAVLELGSKLREAADLERRISELEAAQAAGRNP